MSEFGLDGFSLTDCTKAAGIISLGIPFAPRDEQSIEILARSLYSFLNSRDELTWLTAAALNTITNWTGIAGLRVLHATKFPPRDGITAGVQADPLEAAERAFFDAESRETERKLAEWKQERAKLDTGEVKLIDGVVAAIETAPVHSVPVAANESPHFYPRRRKSHPYGGLFRRAQSDEDVKQIADDILRHITRRA